MIDCGQIIFTGISNKVLTDSEKKFIEEQNIGGVILFSKNYESPAQLAELINSIQQLRKNFPLFIAVDHEGGRVIRFKTHFTQFPPMQDIALLDSPKICFEVHQIMATELYACGINVNLSPCCDVLTNPTNKAIGDRAFSNNVEVVEKFVSSAIRGLQANNLLACAKHFPGHGSTTKDTHTNVVIVKTPLEELKKIEFVPFARAVKSRVEFIMVSHLTVDAIDDKNPASLSEEMYKVIRKDFRFKNIIVTDDMQMGAITDKFGIGDAAVIAINAGADMLIYRDMEQAQIALMAINDALKIKKIKNSTFSEKIERISKTKEKYLKEYKPIYIPEIESKINSKQTQIFLKNILEKIAEQKTQ